MYGADQAAKSAPAGQALGRVAVEQRAMDALLIDLDKRLAGIREGVNRVTEFRHRLMNPRPANVGKEVGKEQAQEPNPTTIEGRLSSSVRYADSLAQDLHELATELERAA